MTAESQAQAGFMPAAQSIFKTPELEKEYMAAYEAVLALWPVSHAPLEVQTQFGTTHVNVCGSQEGPAMLLLPGFGANSTMWFPNIAALSSQFRVYALDTPGQPGKSLPAAPVTAHNSHEWLQSVCDGLGLEKASLVGVSLGGWLALKFALHVPERVRRIVLLDPAASFEKMSAAFVWHSFLPIMVHPTRPSLIKYFRWMTGGYVVNRDWGELMVQGVLNTQPQPPIRATPLTDEELRQVQVPTLLLIGGRSVIYDPQRVYRRATRLIPAIRAEIVPGASHALNAEKSELVNERILQFCQAQVLEDGRRDDLSN